MSKRIEYFVADDVAGDQLLRWLSASIAAADLPGARDQLERLAIAMGPAAAHEVDLGRFAPRQRPS